MSRGRRRRRPRSSGVADLVRCPSCRGILDAALRCDACGRRFALVASDDPADAQARLTDALARAGDEAERARIRSQLSRVLAELYRGDLLLALWTDQHGPEADLWRGAAAVIAQPAGSEDPVAPLERALNAFVADGRRDVVALARSYLIQAYQTVMRIDDAVRVGDAALAAAIEERDGAACVRASSTRYHHIEYELRRNYVHASAELARIAAAVRPWSPAHAAVISMFRVQVMLMTDPQGARALAAGLPPPDATTRGARDRQAHRLAAMEAVMAHDRDAVESALTALTQATPAVGYSELPIFVALCRSWLALIHGDTDVALQQARAAMPPDWHRACPRRRESRLAAAEALARSLPHTAAERRRRAAARAVARAAAFRKARIGWSELRWRLLAGELLRSTGERKAAVRELMRAREIAERLGLERALGLVTTQLRALGVGRSRSASPSGLTARETEIAQLIGKGATNGDIASALVLSEATVARHVSNILLKLDVPNRRAIAERLGAGGTGPADREAAEHT